MTRTEKLVTLIVFAAALAGMPVQAQDLSPGQLASELERLRQSELAANARADALEERVRKLEDMLSTTASDEQLSAMRARAAPMLKGEWIGDSVVATRSSFAAVTSGQPAMSKSRLDPDAEPERKAPAPTAAVEAVTREKQGYFGNRFTIEPAITYSHFDDARINLSGFLALDSIFLGTISLDDVSADIFNADLTARYSFSNRLQVDVNVPYLYRRSSFSSGGAGGNSKGVSETSRSDHGLGDISIGASYRIMRETAGRPDLVLSARVKAPTGRHPFGVELIEVPGSEGNLSVPERLSTGSGVWGASIGVSALTTIDPMVVYGSLTYFYNFQRAFSDIDEAAGDQPGNAKLGSAIQFGAGVAFALNDKSSLNFSYTQRLIGRTRIQRVGQAWQEVAGSQANVSMLNIGATFSLSKATTLITNLGVGLTDDSPNMVLSVRVPVRF
jgi:hypothetical protein